jgi:hypothetical protein
MTNSRRPPSSTDRVATAVALAAVVALGLSAGAMFTEAAFFAPYWRSLPAEEFLAWFAANAQRLFDFYGPLEIVTTVLVVAAAASSRYRRRAGAAWFAAAAVLSLLVLALFPLYFQAANASFATRSIAAADVAAELARWSNWQWLRTALGIAAFLTALLAIRKEGDL